MHKVALFFFFFSTKKKRRIKERGRGSNSDDQDICENGKAVEDPDERAMWIKVVLCGKESPVVKGPVVDVLCCEYQENYSKNQTTRLITDRFQSSKEGGTNGRGPRGRSGV